MAEVVTRSFYQNPNAPYFELYVGCKSDLSEDLEIKESKHMNYGIMKKDALNCLSFQG